MGPDEPVSPELVLVSSSDAAQRARKDLSEPTAVATVELPRRTSSEDEESQLPPTLPNENPRAAQRRERARARRRRRFAVAAVGVIALGPAFGWYVSAHRGHDSAAVGSGARRASDAPATASGTGTFVPARTFVWGASKGADRYLFRMKLDGRVVLHTQTREPRVTLPSSFHFRVGKYRWTVERIPRSTDGKPIADSAFVLTAATAARANK
jgi:hypothetical protein